MSEELQPLPVGTVVNVKGGDQNLVIVSQLPLAEVKGKKGYFDFGAATLPIGIASQELVFFNREDIDKIIFLGYVDASFQQFVGQYDDIVSEIDYDKMTTKKEK